MRNRQIRRQNTKVGSRATLATEGSYLSLEHNETKLRHFSLLLLYVPLCKRQSFEALIDLAIRGPCFVSCCSMPYLLLPYEIRQTFSERQLRFIIHTSCTRTIDKSPRQREVNGESHFQHEIS